MLSTDQKKLLKGAKYYTNEIKLHKILILYGILFSGATRLNFRPLVVTMPARHVVTDTDPLSPSAEELQSSPQIDEETSELEHQLDNGEKHLEKDVAMAAEESDAETVSTKCISNNLFTFNKYLILNTK